MNESLINYIRARRELDKKIILIPIAPAGTGKTSLLHEIKGKIPEVQSISADKIRFNLFNYEETGCDYIQEMEPVVWAIFDKEFEDLIKYVNIIYVDNTNLTKNRRKPLVKLARKNDFEVIYIRFRISLQQMLERNAQRKRKVPREAIIRQYNSLEFDKNYDQLFYIS